MTLPILVVSTLAALWFAADVQSDGERLLTWVAYSLAGVFFIRTIIEGMFIVSEK
jgi:hypothetical protein